MRKTMLFTLLGFLLVFISPVIGQDHMTDETNWEVKQLWDFHETIYQLWHTAWPEKDTELLKQLLPDVEAGYKSLVEVELPGILRDKKEKWDTNLTKLGDAVTDYKSAAEKNDTQALLDAAEQVHSYFEMLVRTIRPVLKEVDAFHQVLYVLYHYNIADYNYDKVKANVEELELKMEELNKAVLPERLNKKSEEFDASRKELSESVNKLAEVVAAGDNKDAIVKAVDAMHGKYQELEKVFD